jgi:acyl carrier protein
MSDVEAHVVAIVAEHLGIEQEEISIDSPFASGLGADSLDQAGMMAAFEKTFCIRFPAGSTERIKTISEVVALIESSRAA